MPCYVTGSEAGDARLDASEARQDAQYATRAACEMAALLKRNNISLKYLSGETRAWIKEHDRIDAKRRKEEQEEAERKAARKRAIKKLSPAEREALNIR